MMVRTVLLLTLLVGCGRKGFDSREIDVPDSTVPDAITIMGDGDIATPMDAPAVCTDDDGVCLFECAGSDTDCNAVCGDGTCTGNGGELCATCASDCKTTNTVCGNGACEGTERDTGCYADCGPGIWQWTAEEAQLIQLINEKRTAGFKCPGTPGGAISVPALTLEPALQPAAREWAWEIAHQNFWQTDGSGCNGRSIEQREVTGGFTAYISSFGFASVQDAFNDWLSAASTCQVLMNTDNTKMHVAVAVDLSKGYIFVLK